MYDTADKFRLLKDKPEIKVLGIESSCDETAAAVVVNGRRMLSNVIASQIEIHRRFGGVVPEVASRNHTMAVVGVVDSALNEAGVKITDIDAIAVTYGAGLMGALLVGVTAAKTLSFATGIPLVKVNHIEAHVAAAYLDFPDLQPPFLALVASGGHTNILDVDKFCNYKVISSTRDDAIGEAFDKVARLLGLPYPGGPEVDRLAKLGADNITFVSKRAVSHDLSLSYSGLKTAVVNYLHTAAQRGEKVVAEDVCASLTHAAVDILVDTALVAAKNTRRDTLVLAGGVASNSYLRETLSTRGAAAGLRVVYPQKILCTDNAAMVAARAYYSIKDGVDLADLTLCASPALKAGAR